MQQVETTDPNDAQAWIGLDVFDRGGDRLGRLTCIYLDTHSGQLAFGQVRQGLFGLRSVLVPLAGAFEEGGALILDVDKHAIKGAPHLRREEPLPPEMEGPLFAHYGMEQGSGPRLELWQPEPADRPR